MTGSLPAEELLPVVLPAQAVRSMIPHATIALATLAPPERDLRDCCPYAFIGSGILTRDDLSTGKCCDEVIRM